MVNRVIIRGNSIIHTRELEQLIDLKHGDELTFETLAQAKNDIEYLDAVALDGVRWHITADNEGNADIIFTVEEKKEEWIDFGISYEPQARSLYGTILVQKANIAGQGINTSFYIKNNLEETLETFVQVSSPFLLDEDVSINAKIYIEKSMRPIRTIKDGEKRWRLDKTPYEKALRGSATGGTT